MEIKIVSCLDHCIDTLSAAGRESCKDKTFCPCHRVLSGFVFQRCSPGDTTLSELWQPTVLFKVGTLSYNWSTIVNFQSPLHGWLPQKGGKVYFWYSRPVTVRFLKGSSSRNVRHSSSHQTYFRVMKEGVQASDFFHNFFSFTAQKQCTGKAGRGGEGSEWCTTVWKHNSQDFVIKPAFYTISLLLRRGKKVSIIFANYNWGGKQTLQHRTVQKMVCGK